MTSSPADNSFLPTPTCLILLVFLTCLLLLCLLLSFVLPSAPLLYPSCGVSELEAPVIVNTSKQAFLSRVRAEEDTWREEVGEVRFGR